MRKLSVGDVVILVALLGGVEEHAAIVTRVWNTEQKLDPANPDDTSAIMVNVTVLPDSAPPFTQSSVSIFANAEAARVYNYGGPHGYLKAKS